MGNEKNCFLKQNQYRCSSSLSMDVIDFNLRLSPGAAETLKKAFNPEDMESVLKTDVPVCHQTHNNPSSCVRSHRTSLNVLTRQSLSKKHSLTVKWAKHVKDYEIFNGAGCFILKFCWSHEPRVSNNPNVVDLVGRASRSPRQWGKRFKEFNEVKHKPWTQANAFLLAWSTIHVTNLLLVQLEINS